MTNSTQTRRSYDKARRDWKVRASLSTLIVCGAATGLFFWAFGPGPAVAALITSAMLTLFAAGYAWDSTERQCALDRVHDLDMALEVAYYAMYPDRPQVKNSLSGFRAWRKDYLSKNGGILEVMKHIYPHGYLPGLEALPDTTPQEVLSQLRTRTLTAAR